MDEGYGGRAAYISLYAGCQLSKGRSVLGSGGHIAQLS